VPTFERYIEVIPRGKRGSFIDALSSVDIQGIASGFLADSVIADHSVNDACWAVASVA
jgi:hypothetical protein